MSYLVGSGLIRYGRHEGRNSLDLMAQAGMLALADAGMARQDIDGLIITTPEIPRIAQVRIASGAGKHLLLEKPMAATVASPTKPVTCPVRSGSISNAISAATICQPAKVVIRCRRLPLSPSR